MTAVGIMQPTYLPWLGYLDMLDQADTFVLLDNVPVSKKSWQTRNRILNGNGPQWLSLPTHAHQGQPLNEVELANEHSWRHKHIHAIEAAYTNAPYYTMLIPLLDQIADPVHTHLTGLTSNCIRTLTHILKIETPLIEASNLLPTRTDRTGRIVDLVRQMQADTLLDTAGAKDIDGISDLTDITIQWHDYTHPEYHQGRPVFTPYMSVIDVIAWHGPHALDIIRSGRAEVQTRRMKRSL